jgi:hypothetical protein
MDMSAAPAWCEWLETTAVGLLVRESTWGFPILVAVHVMAIGTSAGLLFWFDLRLLGVTLTRWPVSALYRRLAPWMFAGFATMIVSGGLLFVGHATRAYPNIYFRLKMSVILLAAANALVYHFVTERGIATWDRGETPASARLAGATSIIVWMVVIVAGRMMAYTMY